MDDKKYFPAWHKIIPVGNNRSVVYIFPLSIKKAIKIDNSLVPILRSLNKSGTFETHVESILRRNPYFEINIDMEKTLQMFVNQGILVPENTLLTAIKENENSSSQQNKIEEMCWITHNQNKSLLKSMQSFIEGETEYQSELHFSIYNDANEDGIEPAMAGKLKCSYSGRKEKTTFLKILGSSLGEKEPFRKILSFAMFGLPEWSISPGANRNCLLLATAGKNVISSDDDIFASFAPLYRSANDALSLTSEPDPSEITFYPDMNTLSDSVPLISGSLLTKHSRFLGRTVNACIKEHLENSDSISFEAMSTNYIHSLLEGNGRVRATCTGVYGDAGMSSPAYYLFHDGDEREQLISSFESYVWCIRNRTLLYGLPRYCITESYLFRGGHISLYNSEMLPPYPPAGRGEDLLFGLLLAKIFPPGAIAHLPFAMLHDPQEKRYFEIEQLHHIGNRLSDILHMLILAIPIPNIIKEPKKRLSLIGDFLTELGSLDLYQFEEYLFTLWTNTARDRIWFLEELLKKYRNQPDYWARDVQNLLSNYEQSLLKGPPILPSDYTGLQTTQNNGGLSPREALHIIVKLMGELLLTWPDIWDAAKELRENGTCMGRTIL